jgi:lysyl-tRNA synthetase class 2
MTKWWAPEEIQRKKPNLMVRMAIIKAIRQFFDAQNFMEVETPILQTSPTMDTHIHAFKTELKGVDLQVNSTPYLHTSPEFAMKKLMVGGIEKLYQICPVFRNAEGSKHHRPEFTMIEWYRAGADYIDIMKDCENLLKACAKAADIQEFQYKEHKCNPFQDFERLSVSEAFERYAELDLTQYLNDVEDFKEAVRDLGLHVADDDAWDDLFFRVMDAKIEPHLGVERPTILYDYPISMACLSRPKQSDPRFAERFELYVCGIELANAFSELTDAKIQKTRFIEEMDAKERLYRERYPVDEDFIKALEFGYPESAGIALGIDRLVMLATGAENIDDVCWCDI